MPMSEAAMDGIRDNGHRWKHQITLRDLTQPLGDLNERYDDGAGEAPKREETEPLVDKIVERVRAFVKQRFERHGTDDPIGIDLDRRADELEMIADCDIEEINHAMGELYDSFDYWRILAN